MQIYLLSILFSVMSFVPQEKDLWVKHTADTCNIEFKFPVKPQIIHKELNGIKSTIFQTKNLTCVFGIVASYFSDVDFGKQDISEIYKEMKAGSLIDRTTVILSENTIAYKKMLVKEIKYSTLIKGKEYIYYKRFIFRGAFAYQLNIGALTRFSNELEASKLKFFNSINFLE